MFSENVDFVEEQFRRWQQDPNSVEPTWQGFFAGMQFAGRLPGDAAPTGAPSVAADVRVQTGVVRRAASSEPAPRTRKLRPVRSRPRPHR
jgi:2-oxoglutarate dehydrogenase E1 component